MSGYFSLPRSFTRDPLWIELPLSYQNVFLVILDHVCWEPRKFDDHGVILDLQPGQICTTERDLAKKCHKSVTNVIVHRSIDKFKKHRFLKQEVKHVKSVLSITDKRLYDLIIHDYEAVSASGLKQDCSRIEAQSNHIINKSNNPKEVVCSEEAPVAPPSPSTPLLRTCIKTHPDGSQLHVSIEDVFRHAVLSKANWSAPEIEEAFDILTYYTGPVRTWERFIEGTIQNLRNAKKYAPITKKTQDKKCSQNTAPSNSTLEKEKDNCSGNATSKAQWQTFISAMGLTI